MRHHHISNQFGKKGLLIAPKTVDELEAGVLSKDLMCHFNAEHDSVLMVPHGRDVPGPKLEAKIVELNGRELVVVIASDLVEIEHLEAGADDYIIELEVLVVTFLHGCNQADCDAHRSSPFPLTRVGRQNQWLFQEKLN
jgi:hypothetical protein